jgi:hypothetical protein
MILNKLIRDNTKLNREELTDLLTDRLSNYIENMEEIFLSEDDIDKLAKLTLSERMLAILNLIEPSFDVVMPDSEFQKLMVFKPELMAIRDANAGSIGEEITLDNDELVKRSMAIYNEETTV